MYLTCTFTQDTNAEMLKSWDQGQSYVVLAANELCRVTV